MLRTRRARTGRPCQDAAMPNGRCKLHGGKSTGPRTPEGLERWHKIHVQIRDYLFYVVALPGRRTVNTDPLPNSLATVTSPPIMRASLRERARPSPVPP
jgi:hypothetical protein